MILKMELVTPLKPKAQVLHIDVGSKVKYGKLHMVSGSHLGFEG